MFRSSTVVVYMLLMLLAVVVKDTLGFCPVQSKTTKGATTQGSPQPSTISLNTSKPPTALSMGLFDSFSKAFQNTEYGPPAEQVRATAKHILVPTKEEAQIVMKMLTSGEQTFEECAKGFSTCPSASKGGSLGNFGPGTMVKEFDQVIFSPETKIGEVMGPVLTQFGHHVIVVEKRTGGGDWY
jgi:peptidyl-prolyl cis-trans isomerase C